MSIQFNLNLLQNGMHFISKSLETIKNQDEDLKYSLINLHAGTQLLLKEILFQEHWSLIFSNLEKADKSKLVSGDFASVNHENLITRLKNVVGVEFDNELLEKMEWLRKERNKAEHYHFVISSDILKSNIVKLFTFLIPFINLELVEKGFLQSEDSTYLEIQEYLHSFDDYIEEKMIVIEEKLEEIELLLDCPICSQQTVEFIDESDAHCYFCDKNIENFTTQYIEMFVDTYSHIKDGGESPLYECPDCDWDTFLHLYDDQYICLSCGIRPTQDDLTTCPGPRCNERFVFRNESKMGFEASFCENCMEYFKDL